MKTWLLTGIALLAVELLLDSGYWAWLGVVGLCMAYLVFLAPHLGWLFQLGVFLPLALTTCLWWRWLKRQPKQPYQDPNLVLNAEQYLHKAFVLTNDIHKGQGKVELDHIIWRLKAKEDYPAGTQVVVYYIDGFFLKVKRSNP